MDVKDAVEIAKNHVKELFANEGLTNLGLEEVEYDNAQGQWRITVGFSRSWDQPGTVGSLLAASKRTYKVVAVNPDGKAIWVKNRETADAH